MTTPHRGHQRTVDALIARMASTLLAGVDLSGCGLAPDARRHYARQAVLLSREILTHTLDTEPTRNTPGEP